MDMQFTPDDLAFCDEVRQFIADEHPKELLGIRYRQHLKREDIYAWRQILYKKGWIAPSLSIMGPLHERWPQWTMSVPSSCSIEVMFTKR